MALLPCGDQIPYMVAETMIKAHLAIARLDPEPQPVGREHRLRRPRRIAPIGVDQRLTPMPLPLTPIVAALHADRHRRRVLRRIGQRVARPAARRPRPEDVAAAGASPLL